MILPGPKPKGKVGITWSPDFAYAIGLIVSDGCVSGDGRHVSFISKDLDQIQNYMKALNIEVKIDIHISGYKNIATAYRCQFSDVLFWNFLNQIGIIPAKSRILGSIGVPREYFFDFLRGCLDGDGYTYSYWDKRWKSSFMLYTGFASASIDFVVWLRSTIVYELGITGHVSKAKKKNFCYQLKYAKRESLILLNKIYENKTGIYLDRKRLKINESLGIMGLKAI